MPVKNYIPTILFFCATLMNAQNYIDILKLSGSTTPPNTFDTSNSKTRIHEIVADLTVPVKINEHLSLLSGVIYENIQTKLFADGAKLSFGSTTLKLGVNKQFNALWSGTGVLLPKIASDYKVIDNKDFQIGAIAFMKYKKSVDRIYKFGLYYNAELFGPFFVPMFGLYYLSPNKKFETNWMLPLQADLNYKLLPLLNVGANFNGQTRSYHLTDITSRQHDSYVVRITNELFVYLKLNVSKSFSFQAKLGHSFARSYRLYDGNDKVTFGLPLAFIGHKRQQLNSDFSDGLIFQFLMLYRFSLEK